MKSRSAVSLGVVRRGGALSWTVYLPALALAVALLALFGCTVETPASPVAEALAHRSQAVGGVTVTTDRASYGPGASVTVTYAGMPGNLQDWIGLAPAGSMNGTYLAYAFTNGQVSGTATFTAPTTNGSYVARAFPNNTYSLLAESAPFSVAGGAVPTITTDSASYTAGSTITATYSGLPGDQQDWIALAPADSPSTTYLQFFFTGGQTSGTATFTVRENGSYVVRALFNNTYTMLAQSSPFSVTGAATPTISTDQTSYLAGSTITVTYGALPGNPQDWIGLAPAGSSDSTYVKYVFTGGQVSGTATFTLPSNGSYVARAFSNNTYTLLAESTLFTVTGAAPATISTDSSSYVSGQTITVTYGGLPGNPNDWISLAPAGSSNTTYVQYAFTNGNVSGTATFTAPGNGSYVVRAMVNNTYTQLVESAPFVVAGGGAPAVTTDASSYSSGATVTVTYGGLPGNPQDWIGLAPAGSTNTTYLGYVFTGGRVSGTATFSAPANAGSYVARAFRNNTYNLLAESAAFSVSSAGSDAGAADAASDAGACAPAAQVAYPVGTTPYAVAAGDFNGDGKTDLAVANSADNTVGVLLNTGAGAFAAQVTYAVESAPASVAVGDFNGDGKPDLAVTNFPNSEVSVLLNTGGGAFAAQVPYAAGGGQKSVAVGDVNGDGLLDLVVADEQADTVGVLLNAGSGTFAAPATYPVGTGPWSVAVGDLTGDGKPDIAVANWQSGSLGVLRNLGSGTFGSQVSYAIGGASRVYSVAMGDFNGDGQTDLAVADFDGTVGVLLNTGNGAFAAQVTYAADEPISVATGDFNGDGRVDLAVANYSNTVGILLNQGGGTFAPQQTYAAGATPYSVAVGDFNGDGVPDLAVANSGDNTVGVLLESCGSSGGTDAGAAVLTLSQPSAAIAPTSMETSSFLSFTLKNTGGAPSGSLAAPGLTGSAGIVVQSDGCTGHALAPNATCTFSAGVSCALASSVAPSAIAGQVAYTDNGGANATLSLSSACLCIAAGGACTGDADCCGATCTSGSCVGGNSVFLVGSTGSEQIFTFMEMTLPTTTTITNVGPSPSGVLATPTDTGNTSEFAYDPSGSNCAGQVLQPGGQCTLAFALKCLSSLGAVYAPQSNNHEYAATLAESDPSSGASYSLSLSGSCECGPTSIACVTSADCCNGACNEGFCN